MENEKWKEVKGYEDIYEVSSLGRVRRVCKTKYRYISLCEDGRGYLLFNLCKNKTKKATRVHRLVAETFIANPFFYPQVNHKNGIKTDNRVDNLEWVTPEQNCKHARENGLQKTNGFKRQPGEANGFSKLKDEQVIEIRRKYTEEKLTYKQIALEYGIHYSTVGYIIQRKRWAHIKEVIK